MVTTQQNQRQNRRDFLKKTSAVMIATTTASTILRASDKAGKKNLVIGTGDFAQKKKIFEDAIAISNSGVFAIVIECVVESLAKKITKSVSVPTIGIGASMHCDGQILVTDDMLGLSDISPKFVKQYSNLSKVIEKCVKDYVKDVRLRRFPSRKNVYR